MLYAIVTHAGVTLSSGHYLAYVRVNGGSKSTNPTHQSMISHHSANRMSLLKTTSPSNQVQDLKVHRKSLNLPGQQFIDHWIECDDETVRIYSEDQFCKMLKGTDGSLLGTPYVLFYHRAVACTH